MIFIKNPTQIERVRKSAHLAAQTLDYLGSFIKEGVSTQKINDLAHQFIVDHGAYSATLNYQGYKKSICTSINDVVCHGVPSVKVVLKEGDIMNVDVAVIIDGFYGDTSRMFMIEPVSNEARQLVLETKNALSLAIKELAPDKYLNDCVGKIIEPYIKKFGYSSVRGLTGHGVGIEFHEDPSVFHFDLGFQDILLRPGMIFTIEPMINQSGDYRIKTDKQDGWTVRTTDGSLSAQWEHTVLITSTGYEILTKN